jgi:membrane protease YdiL (CAAX protease family)
MVAAVIVTAASGGRAALVALASHALRWRVPGRWYLASVGLVAIGALAVAVRAIVRSELPSVHALGRMPGLPDVGWFGVFVLTFLVNGYGEETGWRGFAWPALRERHTIAAAALVLAVPWAIWHLPTFWIDSGMRGFPPLMLPGFFAGMAAGAVVLGRLYERANSSLPVVALFHTVLNMASATKGTEGFPAVAVTAAVMVAAIAILRREARQLPR